MRFVVLVLNEHTVDGTGLERAQVCQCFLDDGVDSGSVLIARKRREVDHADDRFLAPKHRRMLLQKAGD